MSYAHTYRLERSRRTKFVLSELHTENTPKHSEMAGYQAVYDSRDAGARFLAACVFGWSGMALFTMA